MMLRSLLLSLLALVSLAACDGSGGGRAQNSVDVRLLNAVTSAGPLDLVVNGDVKASGVAFGTASAYSNFDFGDRDVVARYTSGGAVAAQSPMAFGPNGIYTVVAYGAVGGALVVPMSEETTQLPAGRIRVRMLGAAVEAPALDLYLVPTADITAATPNLVGVPFTAVGAYVTLDAGTYVVVLAETGTKNVLFQSAPTEFASGSRTTVAALPSLGGRLVGAVLLPTLEASRPLANTLARVRAVNAIANSPPINIRADNTMLFASVTYTGTSDYVTTTSGARAFRAELAAVPGTPIASLDTTLQPARDHTLIAYGTPASPQLLLVADDNAAPGAANARLRFANLRSDGVAVDVRINGNNTITPLVAGAISQGVQVASAAAQTIDFTVGGAVVASVSGATFEGNGVYTLYLFGAGSALQARVVRDR